MTKCDMIWHEVLHKCNFLQKEVNFTNFTWRLCSVHLILKLNFSRTILRQEAGQIIYFVENKLELEYKKNVLCLFCIAVNYNNSRTAWIHWLLFVQHQNNSYHNTTFLQQFFILNSMALLVFYTVVHVQIQYFDEVYMYF